MNYNYLDNNNTTNNTNNFKNLNGSGISNKSKKVQLEGNINNNEGKTKEIKNFDSRREGVAQ